MLGPCPAAAAGLRPKLPSREEPELQVPGAGPRVPHQVGHFAHQGVLTVQIPGAGREERFLVRRHQPGPLLRQQEGLPGSGDPGPESQVPELRVQVCGDGPRGEPPQSGQVHLGAAAAAAGARALQHGEGEAAVRDGAAARGRHRRRGQLHHGQRGGAAPHLPPHHPAGAAT